MPQHIFGIGALIGTSSVANATPSQFGTLQEASVEISFDLKELHGQRQFAVDLGRGKGSVQCKAKFARINGRTWNDLFFATTGGLVTGQTLMAINEAGTIPSTPFQITVANAANFVRDLGVFFQATGLPLKKVAATPGAGEYSVNASGVYTFNTGDASKGVYISYDYSSTSGASMTLDSQEMGIAPDFAVSLATRRLGQTFHLRLYKCVASKLSLPLKNEEFTVPDFEFKAFADAAGNLGTIGMAEA